jgi:hypothetical protein
MITAFVRVPQSCDVARTRQVLLPSLLTSLVSFNGNGIIDLEIATTSKKTTSLVRFQLRARLCNRVSFLCVLKIQRSVKSNGQQTLVQFVQTYDQWMKALMKSNGHLGCVRPRLLLLGTVEIMFY